MPSLPPRWTSTMSRRARCAALAASLLAAASPLAAQGPPERPPLPAEAVEPAPPPGGEADAAEASPDAPQAPGAPSSGEDVEPVVPPRREPLPTLDIYFPEGDLDLRLNRLIKNAFFEGQIRYNFVDADISAFLRYRYYGFRRTYTVGVFDDVEFENVEKLDNDFERVRGGLLLTEWPHSYSNRSFILIESDRITSSKEEFRFSTDRTNVFLRLGHQIGTPSDPRSNAIVGETRATVPELFTAPRKIGPLGAGLTVALTFADDYFGDFDYIKGELETLKRFNHGPDRFLIARLHAGTFFSKKLVRTDPELEPIERFAIPRTEFFRLDGRDNLRGLGDALRGTEEIHSTLEYFLPWFVERERRAIGLTWDNWYWILYGGVGTVGFDREVSVDSSSYIPDIGLGFESSFRFKGLRLFLTGIVAYAIGEEGGPQAHLSMKSYR